MRVNGRAAGEHEAVQPVQNVGNAVCVIAALDAEYAVQRVVFGGQVMIHVRGRSYKQRVTPGLINFSKAADGQSLTGCVVLISRNEGITNLANIYNGLGAAGGVGAASRIPDERLRGQRKLLRITGWRAASASMSMSALKGGIVVSPSPGSASASWINCWIMAISGMKVFSTPELMVKVLML